MLSLGPYHPIIVHFAIALLFVGVLFRLLSLTGRAAFSGPAAATLLLLGTIMAAAASYSGDQAHGPVERVPGSRDAVEEHEEWADRTRNIFFGVAALEILGLIFSRKGKAKALVFGSALVGLAGLFCLYQTGQYGGRIVYSYAGGVGIRTGDPADVGRLLLAGLYHQAQEDRRQGRPSDANHLYEEMQRRYGQDPAVQLLAAESLLLDRNDASGALAALEKISVPAEDRRLVLRRGLLLCDIQLALGKEEAARSVLQELQKSYPNSEPLKQRLAKLKKPAL